MVTIRETRIRRPEPVDPEPIDPEPVHPEPVNPEEEDILNVAFREVDEHVEEQVDGTI